MNKQLRQHIVALTFEDKGHTWLSLGNSRLDFSKPYIFNGFTKSGKIKLQEVYSWDENAQPISTKNRYGIVETAIIAKYDNGTVRKQVKIHTDGWSYSHRFTYDEVSESEN